MDPRGTWPDRRQFGLDDLDRRGYPRQSNVSGHRRRCGRLEQARCNPQRQNHKSSYKDHSASLRPANPQTHAQL